MFELLTPLVRHWRLIFGTATGCALVAAVLLLLQRPVYTAETNFTPETPNTSGLASSLVGLAGLAGQLGLGDAMSGGASPEFFARLLHSREVLRATLQTEFPDPGGSGTKRQLLDLLEIKGKNLEERLQLGTRRLTQATEAHVDQATGIVTLSVEMYSPELAAATANRMLELLNEFNLERRQSQSHEQRRFTGDRLREAEQELREAERAQLRFLQNNRQYQGSPLLEFQAEQLERAVQLKQEVFLTLTKAHEEARIAEVRDTPVLTVVDPAVPPAKRSRPRRALGVTLAFAAGSVLGISLVYLGIFRRRVRRDRSPDYMEFQAALDEVRGRSARARS
ncbi:MAG TPA: Wzz/FepE/Etk N-terminal domain-containing protein [Gemmatimonadales bacterium]|nr:Wzz/FepE/Etk N-terminal domain-containing protein [Gemmatimonadales bacterium]